MLKESDFHGPYTDPKTGYEYENFGAWFAGEEPRACDQNEYLALREAPRKHDGSLAWRYLDRVIP